MTFFSEESYNQSGLIYFLLSGFYVIQDDEEVFLPGRIFNKKYIEKPP
jgi:hypothetical protein